MPEREEGRAGKGRTPGGGTRGAGDPCHVTRESQGDNMAAPRGTLSAPPPTSPAQITQQELPRTMLVRCKACCTRPPSQRQPRSCIWNEVLTVPEEQRLMWHELCSASSLRCPPARGHGVLPRKLSRGYPRRATTQLPGQPQHWQSSTLAGPDEEGDRRLANLKRLEIVAI